jgi:multidrug resistance efflux pump
MSQFNRSILRVALTFGSLGVGGAFAYDLWSYYTEAPWTRDGRVRAEVVSIAPEISGRVTEVKVADNQLVAKGDILYVIDSTDFQLNVELAQTQVEERQQDFSVKASDDIRRDKLSNMSVSDAERERYRAAAAIARAAQKQAVTQLEKAKIDLERTSVRAPVNGYVTNLRVRAGDYAAKGAANIALVDSDSFWVAGYFEETKLPRVHVGDRVEAALMGYDKPMIGHVESIAHAISDQNGAADGKGLANVNPVFSWVRLAQRIPVRIHIDEIPQGMDLAAGTTCTINVVSAAPDKLRHFGLLKRLGIGS